MKFLLWGFSAFKMMSHQQGQALKSMCCLQLFPVTVAVIDAVWVKTEFLTDGYITP